ncbi:hypothetical protein IP956_16960 [Leptospira borgpetersenii serovar Hardjo-bovis]|nr:hypothetical protein [Leptospira borgpetersenii serovar Hardjo-bovis]MBE8372136.1 hypothetical protein [Leptospira borgpetersenii serovar Hardjo-bovis]MBE8375309.1 hypothetical protein [Leptospira borgpetersenii serovar Hardjo-bovis]MBE8391723.1 hypothetical protein [Leptospira borgpetersenii serovar Hardjo-bovis]
MLRPETGAPSEAVSLSLGSNIELKRGPAFSCKGWIRPNFLTARSKNCGSDPSKAVL